MSEETLRMVRVALDGERLFEFAQRRSLPTRDLDLGYVAHCALQELFGEPAPQPFSLAPRTGRWQSVLGYATQDAEALHEAAKLQADPWLYQHVVDWSSLASKPMPTVWRVGQRLDFTVRACPVVRTMRAGTDGVMREKHREVDAFLAECWRVGDPKVPVDRMEVYRRWLAEQFERHGGAAADEVRVSRFTLERLARKHHAEVRRMQIKGRPDATFEGTLAVTDPVAFAALLRRGVGRHRAFGFGMLLLRPPRGG